MYVVIKIGATDDNEYKEHYNCNCSNKTANWNFFINNWGIDYGIYIQKTVCDKSPPFVTL